MLGKNNSYFDIELCLDGHYIVTGYTNDQFCNDVLQLSDVKYELHRYLRYEQHFDAVFFLDSVNMLFCYDQQSYDILRGSSVTPPDRAEPGPREDIIAATPLGRRRRRREGPQGGTAAPERPARPSNRGNGPLHMGRQAISGSWAQVTTLLRVSEYRCALILSNVDSLITSMGVQEMAILEELQSYHSSNHSIVVYLFRDTSISTLTESVNHSLDGASNQWARFVQNVLRPRIEAGTPEANRVISLRTPNRWEVKNLLNHMRLRPDNRLRILAGDIEALSEVLAASCARQRWGLGQLLTRLDRCIMERPDRRLSMETWRAFMDERNYRPPMEQLDQLIGMEGVKRDIREWYAHQLQAASSRERSTVHSSRFAPLPVREGVRGHGLNIRLKGNPGTGKTTVARLMGMLYYELGLLPQGQLIECSASDLVSQNVGGTAQLVRERVQEAMGGVLFVDEAYALATNRHGLEAINQLVNDLSTYEGQFAVVLAGYPSEIDRLMQENDGLARRFPTEYVLPDYSADEMERIFRLMVEHDAQGVVIGQELDERLPDFCDAWVGGRTRGWGNAGEAETLLLAMKKRCSARLSMENREGDRGPAVFELSPADIPENLRHCLVPRSKDLREALEEIDRMIGLAHVKRFLRELSQNIQWGVEKSAPGNYIFSGAPGTGKTTVARRMGEILGHLGVLRRKTNNVIECRAADLLNGTVRLSEIVEDARGGILFIDEAHQLEQNQRGHEIIRELVPLIENPEIRADTCFICAGYTAEMRQFLEVDRGLSRRFPANHRIRFDDYNASELVEILEAMARARGEIPHPAYLSRSKTALGRYLEQRPANFGNGGFIRDVYLPDSIAARTARLNAEAAGGQGGLVSREVIESIPLAVRRTLTEHDIPRSFLRFAGPPGKGAAPERTARVLLGELYGKDELTQYVESRFQPEEDGLFFDGGTEAGLHYSVAGPAGSGRHTAVKAVAAAWKELGLLEKEEVLFVGKADLEAGYVGQTAIKAQNVVEQAVGGTLAVCSPSALLPKSASDNSFGPEALGVIAGAMAEHFHDLCVVFLDTCEGMEALFKALPALRGRLHRQFVWEDLQPEAMLSLFRLKTVESMAFEERIEGLLPDFFLNWVSDRGGLGESARSWANGGEVDRLVNDLIQNWKRVGGTVQAETEEGENGVLYSRQRRLITEEMFPPALRKYLNSNRAVAETALRELEAMTGLSRVKASIRAIERRMRLMPAHTVTPGLYCYVGNPGVGKTTVARLMGGILKAAGVLSQGHVIVKTARQMCDSVDEFESIIKLARNGILFIDEAHQLAEPANPYGRSVIKKLLTVLEDMEVISHTSIILAGYPEDMARLFYADSGLASRFGTANSIIFFDDYTPEELLQILDQMAEKAPAIPQIGSGYPLRLSDEYRQRSLEIFRAAAGAGNSDYGNARFVRNYLHDSMDELLERIDEEYGLQDDPPTDVVDYLTVDDIPRRYRRILQTKRETAAFSGQEFATASSGPVTPENCEERYEELKQGVVLLETYSGGAKQEIGTGCVIAASGHVLTCAHVVKGAEQIRARIYSPGMPGGDYRWFDCTLMEPVCDDCDMAVLRMEGKNFHALPLRSVDLAVGSEEKTLLIGYPLGAMLAGNHIDELSASVFEGRVASVQTFAGVDRYYIDSTGLHGNSGSPVISLSDGRVIGIFAGSIVPRQQGNLDELNYFYPISYFWARYVQG